MISKFNDEAVKAVKARLEEHVGDIRSLHEARERKYNSNLLLEPSGAYARYSAEVDIALKKADASYETWAEASNALNKPEEGWFKFNKRNKDIPF